MRLANRFHSIYYFSETSWISGVSVVIFCVQAVFEPGRTSWMQSRIDATERCNRSTGLNFMFQQAAADAPCFAYRKRDELGVFPLLTFSGEENKQKHK